MNANAAATVVVLGANSLRTIDVLRTLSRLRHLSWLASDLSQPTYFSECPIACIVIADDLDNQSALTVLGCLRNANPARPIYLVTDANDMQRAVEGMRLGATAVVEIPPSYELLRDYVSRALTHSPESSPLR